MYHFSLSHSLAQKSGSAWTEHLPAATAQFHPPGSISSRLGRLAAPTHQTRKSLSTLAKGAVVSHDLKPEMSWTWYCHSIRLSEHVKTNKWTPPTGVRKDPSLFYSTGRVWNRTSVSHNSHGEFFEIGMFGESFCECTCYKLFSGMWPFSACICSNVSLESLLTYT